MLSLDFILELLELVVDGLDLLVVDGASVLVLLAFCVGCLCLICQVCDLCNHVLELCLLVLDTLLDSLEFLL